MSDAPRGRPPLPLAEIYSEALALMADGGMQTLGMRALARRLGSSTSTLYRQFPGGKDELCNRLAEHVMAEVVAAIAAADLTAGAWDTVIERSAVITFDVLRDHPHSAALFAGQVLFGPAGLLRYERALDLLMGTGLSAAAAAAADHALGRLIIGYALQSAMDTPDSRATVVEYYRGLDQTEFPHVTAVVPAVPKDLRTEFVFALQTFMDGLRSLVAEGSRDVRAGGRTHP
ncbi:helix-turn-helix domain-containing protein [Gordonia sp. PKS22-38]|uniref:Helix-turn-helix domain-containing protein n=1 Tax=Gordonia prachuapensis TaxID=3115651 RepID=A0ABU7MQF4_9ACTN|nr:helix-turn-helix domain-containing protein [Gordonia sp. PKS22-38]